MSKRLTNRDRQMMDASQLHKCIGHLAKRAKTLYTKSECLKDTTETTDMAMDARNTGISTQQYRSTDQ